MDIDVFVQKWAREYIKKCGFRRERISVHLENSIFEGAAKYAEGEQKASVLAGKERLEQFNGTMIYPNNVEGEYHVIISKQYAEGFFKEGYPAFLTTIAHEITHAYDYSDYIKKFRIQDMDQVTRIEPYEMFHHWTEYHARCCGTEFFYADFLKDGFGNNKNLEQYIAGAKDFKELYDKQNASNPSAWDKTNAAMALLGRMKAWDNMFPHKFSPEAIDKVFVCDEWLLKIYKFLYSINSTDEALEKLSEFKELVV